MLIHQHAQRSACRQCTVDCHSVPGHHPTRVPGPRQSQPPCQITGKQQAFTHAQQQTRQYQQHKAYARRDRQQHGGSIGRPCQRNRQHTVAGGGARTLLIRAPAGKTARQQCGKKLAACCNAYHQVAHAKLLMHIQRDHRQCQSGSQIAEEHGK